MKVLVTGVEGYIGALLAPKLVERGFQVVGLDTGYYRDGWLHSDKSLRPFPVSLRKDIRHVLQKDLQDFDAVVHLAELSNDPLGEIRPEVTHQINHGGSVGLAEKSKAAGVARFVYNSSCSVYGVGTADFLDETDPTNPQTAYARCKVLAERDIAKLADDTFSPVFLRCATAYGPSPRMRFDIVLNNLAGLAWTTRKIAMLSDGTPWRPLVHVLDICEAITCALKAPRESIHNEIFNVGDNRENYQVRQIAGVVADEFQGCEVSVGPRGGDNRSYRVSFDKIHRQLPGFRCERDARIGARQLHEVFEQTGLTKERFEDRAFTRLKQLQHLVRTNQIDDAFFWKT